MGLRRVLTGVHLLRPPVAKFAGGGDVLGVILDFRSRLARRLGACGADLNQRAGADAAGSNVECGGDGSRRLLDLRPADTLGIQGQSPVFRTSCRAKMQNIQCAAKRDLAASV